VKHLRFKPQQPGGVFLKTGETVTPFGCCNCEKIVRAAREAPDFFAAL
jgi:hypothetical protein